MKSPILLSLIFCSGFQLYIHVWKLYTHLSLQFNFAQDTHIQIQFRKITKLFKKFPSKTVGILLLAMQFRVFMSTLFLIY